MSIEGKKLRSGKVVSEKFECDIASLYQSRRNPKTIFTRSSTNVYLIGQPSSCINGSKLPTNRQVFRYFLHLRNENPNKETRSLAYSTLDGVLPFWTMARIKTLTTTSYIQHFMALHEKYRKLVKNRGRLSQYDDDKRLEFSIELDKLFDIGSKNAIDEINLNRLLTKEDKEKDIKFYLDQQTTRIAHMSGHDKIFEEKTLVKKFREDREKRMSSTTELTEVEEIFSDVDTITYQDFSSNDSSKKEEKICLLFPRSIMACDEICETADRLSLSDNQTMAMVSSVLKAGGADLNDFILSTSTTRRKRIITRHNLSQEYMANFKANPPLYCTLHWDGKLLRDVLGENYPVECLAVLVSGAPQYEEGKLLGVPFLEKSTGIKQCNATIELIETWGVEHSVVGLVFDTTASNSGMNNGSAKLIEEKLGKKMFYFACRHHISEIIIRGVWEALFGKMKSPNSNIFSYVKDKWNTLDKSNPKILGEVEQEWQEIKANTIAIVKRFLEKTSPRTDYREVAELCLILLGTKPPRGIHWTKPGAVHQARWMARNIYSIKMYMFSEKLQYSHSTIFKLERLNKFLALFYTSYWITSTSAADAPINDLQLFKSMFQYISQDSDIATSVLNKLKNHRWYLTQETVIFVLFSSHESMTKDTKENIAVKLSKTEKPESYRKGKPVFPQITEATTFLDLIGPESYFLFDALGLKCVWLTKPAETWEHDSSYRKTLEFIKSVKVTNDVAERGVKMISDFATNITTDQEQRHHLLQVVEYNRRKFNSFRKATMNQ